MNDGSWLPRGIRYMATAAFFFSIMSLLVKVAGRRLPSQEVVFARSLVMLCLTWVVLRRSGRPIPATRRGLLLLRGVLGFGALSCFYYALVHLPLADATVIQYTNPAFTAVIAVWVLRERMRVREAACVLLSLAGVVTMARPALLFGGGVRLDPVAVAVGLAGAFFSACAYVTVRKLGATEAPLVIILYFASVSVLGSAVPVALIALRPTAVELAVLIAVGCTTYFGQLFMTRGLHLERAGRATAVGYVQIVFAALWGALAFGRIPDGWTIAGALLVIGSTAALGSSVSEGAAPPEV